MTIDVNSVTDAPTVMVTNETYNSGNDDVVDLAEIHFAGQFNKIVYKNTGLSGLKNIMDLESLAAELDNSPAAVVISSLVNQLYGAQITDAAQNTAGNTIEVTKGLVYLDKSAVVTFRAPPTAMESVKQSFGVLNSNELISLGGVLDYVYVRSWVRS